MLLVIDVGNTNIVFAVFDNDTLKGKWRLSTDCGKTVDEYAIALNSLMKFENIKFSSISDVIISSVVPKNLFEITTFCKKYFSATPFIVGDDRLNLGIEIKVDLPKEVGADRLVNSISAYNLYKSACIVIDFGTATTFDVVDTDGNYIGGIIAPGINLSMEALHIAAAKLPEISIRKPKKVIGKSTTSAMQSGIYFGYLGLIEGIIERIKSEYSSDMITIATGGLAPLFASGTDKIEHLEKDLTIYGLKYIYSSLMRIEY